MKYTVKQYDEKVLETLPGQQHKIAAILKTIPDEFTIEIKNATTGGVGVFVSNGKGKYAGMVVHKHFSDEELDQFIAFAIDKTIKEKLT